MAIDFPNSPTVGQIFTSGSFSWRWDGTRWVSVAMGSSIAIGDTPPSSPYTGQLWWDSIGGQAYLYYQDPNTTQWVPLDNQAGSPLILPRGVVDGSNAVAGQVGEYRSAIVSNTSPVGILANQWSQVTALTLPAGDWDVDGYVGNAGTGSTAGGMTAFGAAVSPTITPVSPADNTSIHFTYTNVTGAVIPTSLARLSLSATTPVYLCTYIGYTTGSANAYGLIRARRAR